MVGDQRPPPISSLAMENSRPKIKLKNILKDRTIENAGQRKRDQQKGSGFVDHRPVANNENGFFPIVSNDLKRKRAQKAGPRKDEQQKLWYSADILSTAASFDQAEERHPNPKNVKTKEDQSGQLGKTRLVVGNANLATAEAGSKERLQSKEGSLKIRLKPSKSRRLSPSTTDRQDEEDNDSTPVLSNFSDTQSLKINEGFQRKFNLTYSRSEVHKSDPGFSGSKLNNKKITSTRHPDVVQTPVQTKSRPFQIPNNPHQTETANASYLLENKKILNSQRNPTESNNLSGIENGKHTFSSSSKKELETSLMVIKKIMKMDAAEPFNAPVDPVALGIPDYFDIITTPMDFSTICNELEKGKKYKNSEDVFRDVQLIWENCLTYNRKGDPILELMKRVKKNFAKYWTAAGLYYESQKRPSVKADMLSAINKDQVKDRNLEKLPTEKSSSNDDIPNVSKAAVQVVERGSSAGTSQIESSCAVEKDNEHNTATCNHESLDAVHSSEEKESKVSTCQNLQTESLTKKRGIKLVLKKTTPVIETVENGLPKVNELQESMISGPRDESGPVLTKPNSSSQEQTIHQNTHLKNKSHRRYRNQKHKPGCMCAVCVVLRKKYARTEKPEHVANQTLQTITNTSEMSYEHGTELEVETDEVQGEEQHVGEHEPNERLKQGQISVEEAHDKSEDHQDSAAKKQHQVDNRQDRGGSCYFSTCLQSASPEVLNMCNALFPRETRSIWNQQGFSRHHRSMNSSKNPFMAAISSFLK